MNEASGQKNIVVVGAGHVGLSLAVLLAHKHYVTAIDSDVTKVVQINSLVCPIHDDDIKRVFQNVLAGTEHLNLRAVSSSDNVYQSADFIIVSVPTDYDTKTNCFDCSIVESVVQDIMDSASSATIIIKSTVPVGFTQSLNSKYQTNRILFSPEFLRESNSLHDCVYPSRIIVSYEDSSKKKAEEFAKLLLEGAADKSVEIAYMGHSEAEAVKLFSNTFLALRVSYFNELDTYAEKKGLNTGDIIKGVCMDSRIGDFYNNPSFGYGGYCLPKDTKQLLANYEDVPEKLIRAVVESNETRIDYITERILETVKNRVNDEQEPIVGIYRLTMKSDSDSFKQSSIREVMNRIKEKGIKMVIYEPVLADTALFEDSLVVNDLEKFKCMSHLIVANRYDKNLETVKNKIYTRDLYGRD